MRQRAVGAIIVLALMMGAIPATAEAPPAPSLAGIEIHPVRVTVGANLYITWNRTEVRNFVERFGWVYPGSLAIGNSICAVVSGFILATVCRVGVTLAAYSIWTTFARAAVQGQCVTLVLGWNGTVRGLQRLYPWQTARC